MDWEGHGDMGNFRTLGVHYFKVPYSKDPSVPYFSEIATRMTKDKHRF